MHFDASRAKANTLSSTAALFLAIAGLAWATGPLYGGAADGGQDLEVLTDPLGQEEEMFDLETGLWLVDTDGDTYPDLTEERMETDPFDADSYPGQIAADTRGGLVALPESAVDIESALCRSGFVQRGTRLCATGLKGPSYYDDATIVCGASGARVCAYSDLYYIYTQTTADATFNPLNRFIGNIIADSTALCGSRSITFNNDPDIVDFDKACPTRSFGTKRNYWCCHTKGVLAF